MKQVTVATLKLCGGHPALDFTNTVHSRGPRLGPDVLQDHDDLLHWSVRAGVLATAEAAALDGLSAARGRSALARAKLLREAVHRIFASPLHADADDLDLLCREAFAAQEMRRLVREADGYAWRWRADDPDTVTHRIAHAAAELLTSPRIGRIRACPAENCGWLFLDTSRAGRRVWCSEETCGTRTRVRRWRAKEV